MFDLCFDIPFDLCFVDANFEFGAAENVAKNG